VRFTSPSRRAAGLLAVTTIGLSTAVLSVTGIASAQDFQPNGTDSYTVTSDGAADSDNDFDVYDASSLTIPTGYCSVDWYVSGARGGASSSDAFGSGGIGIDATTAVTAGEKYLFSVGENGGNATPDDVEAATNGAVGTAGTPNGQAGSGDDDGGYGGGGGGSTTVSLATDPESDPVVVFEAPGGTGGEVSDTSTVGGAGGGEVKYPASATEVDQSESWGAEIVASVNPCDVPDSDDTSDDSGDISDTPTDNTQVDDTPMVEVPGPVTASVKAGVQSVTFSWTAPADTEGLTSYTMEAYLQVSDDVDPATIPVDTKSVLSCDAPVTATTCTVAAAPGFTYGGHVEALYGDYAYGDTPAGSTGVVSAPAKPSASVPTAQGTLTSDDADGKVVAGEKITISGKDFLPGSTVDLIVYSSPVELGTATVLDDGTFSAIVVLPKGLENGTHHLVATGVDVNGNVRNLVVEVTVSGGTAVLAYTGFSALPYAGAGAVALLAGAGLLVAGRRRSAQH